MLGDGDREGVMRWGWKGEENGLGNGLRDCHAQLHSYVDTLCWTPYMLTPYA